MPNYNKNWATEALAAHDELMRELEKPSKRGDESIRFLPLLAEELARYHSISCWEELAPSQDTSPFFYKSTRLEEPHELPEFTDELGLPFSRFIPPDGRIALPFDSRWTLLELKHRWILECIEQEIPAYDNDACTDYIFNERISKIDSINNFFSEEFKTFGGFIVWDIDPWTQDGVAYDIGCHLPCARVPEGPPSKTWRKTERLEVGYDVDHWLRHQKLFCQVDQQLSRIAPWQRIILCQGLSLAQLIREKTLNFPFIGLQGIGSDETIRRATDLHLSGARRGGSETTNPYSDPQNAFHITFYERLIMPNSDALLKASKSRSLKIGHLFDKPREVGDKNGDELAFRCSAFTMIATARPTQIEKQFSPNCERYWTMLILSPSGFFPLPTDKNPDIAWKIDVGQTSRQTAELSCIVYALREVDKRWHQFSKHIGSLLVEDFMDPTAYTKLLFDDETFSRSRLYFWILGCLNEFDVVIEDNIKQWILYRRARLHHLLDLSPEALPKPSPELSPLPPFRSPPEPLPGSIPLQFDSARDLIRLQELDKEAAEIRQSLEDLRKEFKAQRVTVQALRDGLFNASALMESRSSTRLGMNVQLLTYVSIFYLPLAFCAALWAIPNITDDKTRNPFICTVFLVGFGTYAVVFNLGNISELLGSVYFKRRERLLQEMEDDQDESWQKRRGQFDQFPPNQEKNTPSEWWMIRYQMHRLFGRRKPEAADSDAGTA